MSDAAVSPQGFAARPDLRKKRDASLDLMRFLGIVVIMLAHAEPPDWLFQARNFGTPLLVVASALTTAVIYRTRRMEPLRYWRKRLTRLTIPAWLFLSAFFAFFYLFAELLGRRFAFSSRQIVESYTFSDGIGFVWIFKVYIILALIAPFALWYKNRGMPLGLYFGSLALMYVGYEALWAFAGVLIPPSIAGATGIIFYAAPYSILFLYGLRMGELSRRTLLGVSIVSLLICAGLSTRLYLETGTFVPTQDFKYPPRLYYLSYSFFAIHLIYLFCRRYGNNLNTGVVQWLSANSLWIYLWHIMATYLWRFTLGPHDHGLMIATVEACYLLGFGIACAWMQGVVVRWWQERVPNPTFGLLLSYLR